MANSAVETAIGAVVLAAAVGFLIYAGQTRGVEIGGGSYPLTASFRTAEGVSVGTDVRLAGINVGSVTGLDLDPETYQARMTFTVRGGLEIPEDTDIKIASESLLGGSYVELTPGASEFMLQPGDEILNTQGSVSLLDLLLRFGTGK
jgi:phospholipid/cholesterol/gamma-HCH transport system substrate-binding protein